MPRLLYIFVLKFVIFYEKIDFGDAVPLIRDHIVLAERQEFPFVVSVGRKKTEAMCEEETHFCGGALITKKHVLTAQHCSHDVDNIKEVEIKIGSNDLQTSKKYGIDAWDTFDDWIFRNHKIPRYLRGNDISVITLSKTVNIKPAFIWDAQIDEWIGKTAVTAGWGLRKNGERPKFMEKATLNILCHAECDKNIEAANLEKEVFEVPLRYLCTNAKPYVVLGCGDSGSPLIVNNNTIIAINKSSCPRRSRCISQEQNLHVGIHYYMRFIRNITESTVSKSLFRTKIYRVSTQP